MKMDLRYVPKTVGFAFATRFRHLFGIDQMTCAPVALNEAPGTGDIDGVPRVAEAVVLEAHSRLITG